MQSKIILLTLFFWICFFWVTLHLLSGLDKLSSQLVWAQSTGPTLAIPTEVVAGSANTVTVPVNFRTNGASIAAIVFSIDFDQTCLHFDASDHDGNTRPDSIRFNIPAQMSGTVTYDPADTQGELDIVIADYAPPITALPDRDNLVAITFTATCIPSPGQVIVAPIQFSTAPMPSFSDPIGHSVSGATINGSVEIRNESTNPTPMATPSFTPMPTATNPSAPSPTAMPPTSTPTTTPMATVAPTVLVTGTISAQSGGVIKSERSELNFPPGAVTNDIAVIYQEKPLVSPPLGALLRGIELNAYRVDTSQVVTNFAISFTLVISYTPADLVEAEITDESQLWLYYRAAADQPWQPVPHCTGCGPNLQAHTFTIRLNHFTQFALIRAIIDNKRTLFLPVVYR